MPINVRIDDDLLMELEDIRSFHENEFMSIEDFARYALQDYVLNVKQHLEYNVLLEDGVELKVIADPDLKDEEVSFIDDEGNDRKITVRPDPSGILYATDEDGKTYTIMEKISNE